MKLAAYVFYAIAVIVAIVGIYSIFVLREGEVGAAGTGTILLFTIGTLLALFVGIGLRAVARQNDED